MEGSIKTELKYIKEKVDRIEVKLDANYITKEMHTITHEGHDKRIKRLENAVISVVGTIGSAIVGIIVYFITKGI